jgi:hypothetical protein
MTTLDSLQKSRATAGRRFYVVMALVLAAIAIFGFSHTVPGDFGIPGFPVLLWVHGAVFTAWVVLFVAQPVLTMRKSVRWHRRLGWAGAALAVAMVALACSAIMLALWANTLPPFYPHGLFIVRGVFGLLVFAGLVTAAILKRRQSEWHKRLILCAAITVVVPGLERAMPIPLLGPYWFVVVDAVVDLIALAGPAVDLVYRRRVHAAYVWGVGAIVLGQVIVDVLAPSPVATALLHAVGAS